MLKPKHLSREVIRQKAEEFRQRYVFPIERVPVPIEEIIEFSLDITPEPVNNLKRDIDVDGFLSRDLKTIVVDNDVYSDSRYEKRLRFTYAHEIGHLVLHKEDIQSCEFRSTQDWLRFREDMSEEDLGWFEQQAYEFAGRLLVPKKILIQALEEQRLKIEKFKEQFDNDSDDLLITAISKVICDNFGVSDGVLYRRIKYEKIWETMKF